MNIQLLVVTCAFLCHSVSDSFANTYPVTNTMDSGTGSLRDAVTSANSNPGIDTIIFDNAINGDTILLTAADDIDITGALYIKGNGPANTIIDGNNNARIFEIASFLFCKLEGMTLQNGNATGGGFPDNAGGAILNNGVLRIHASVISDNSAIFGGGISNTTSATVDFYRASIVGNDANSGGGMDNFGNSMANFHNSIISGNQADFSGGGVFNSSNSTVNFHNSTVSGNQADDGGGISNDLNGTIDFSNSIVALNTALSGPDLLSGSGVIAASHSLIGDNTDSDFPAGNNNIIGTPVNPVDPLFAEDIPNAPSTGGNLQLQPCSPAINAGTNDSLNLASDTIDIAGEPRIVYDTVDMGAYEMQSALFSDDLLVITPYNDGCGSLRSAVDNAMPGDTVRFDPSIDGNTIKLTGDQIIIDTNIAIMGNGVDLTIIDACDTNRIFEVRANDSVLIMGVTMQNGNVSQAPSFPENWGGALQNNGYLVVHNCAISGSKGFDGGGFANLNNSTLNFYNTSFTGNSATESGGGGFNFNSTANLYNTFFSDNQADGGGAVLNDGGTINFYNSAISGNQGNIIGGGIINSLGATANYYNTSISGNRSNGDGGAIYNFFSTLSFYNSAISGNQADTDGGAIFNSSSSTASFFNVSISGNQAGDQGGGVFNPVNSSVNFSNSIIALNSAPSAPDIFFDSGTITASHSLIGDNTDSNFPVGNNNIVGTTANPVDPLFAEDVPAAPSLGGNLRLQPCSPAINAGTNDSLNLATDTLDLAGNPRVVYDTVDMGAFELQGQLFTDDLLVITTFNDGCGSLRSAINNAQKQDTVRFDPSIDNDTIKLTGDQIIIDTCITIFGNGIGRTIIDGCNFGRIFLVNPNDTVSFVGVTLQNGNVAPRSFPNNIGGGILNGGNLSFNDCAISRNSAEFGGGIYNDKSAMINFYRTVISGNQANFTGGGMINLTNATANFYNTTISGNIGINLGGGIYNVDTATANFYYTDITDNQSESGGGLFNNIGAIANVHNSTISENQANFGGGFVQSRGAKSNFYSSVISGNQANFGGGIMNLDNHSTANFYNTTISGNEANFNGGGIFNLDAATANFYNTTITGNQANSGGGVQKLNSRTNFINSIIANNSTLSGSGTDLFFDGGIISASHSLIGDNSDSNFPLGNSNIIGTAANPIEPLFVMAVDTMNLPNTSGDLRLLPCSPAINAGTNDSLNLATDTVDLAGDPRIVYDTVDMGAYEMQGARFNDDLLVITTYDDGCGSLRSAVGQAQRQDTVRFDPSIDGDTIKLSGDQIVIDTSITIWGNGPAATIVDACDTGRIFEINPNDTVSLKGVTMQNGNPSGGAFPDNAGGAVYNSGMIRVYDCMISDNRANFGGGVQNFDNATAMFYNSAISNNQATFGGGIDNEGNSSVSFYDCVISDNRAASNGGGVDNFDNVTAVFYNTSITGNQAGNVGGGVLNFTNATATFNHSIISGNQAGFGGGVYNQANTTVNFYNTVITANQVINFGGGVVNFTNATATFNHSTIAGNQAGFGGGVYNEDSVTVNFYNTMISGNSANLFGGGVDNIDNVEANFKNTTVSGNVASFGGGVDFFNNSTSNITNSIFAMNTAPSGPDLLFESGIISASHSLVGDSTDSFFPIGNNNIIGSSTDPVDPLFVEDVPAAPSTGGDLRLQSCSPARNTGINDSLSMSDSLDLAGNPRIAYGTVDMGAFEYTDPAPTDTIFYIACVCQDTLVIDDINISGLYRAAQLIRIEGNATLNGDTEIWAREVEIDPIFETPAGIRFATFTTGCQTE